MKSEALDRGPVADALEALRQGLARLGERVAALEAAVGAKQPAAGTPPPPRPGPAPAADESKVCRSPIAGVVVRVSAQVGQAIQANDVLLVLEAMKMETVITSPLAGKVAQVNVRAGDAVQGGQVL